MKKLLGILLIVTLVVSLFPTAAFAESASFSISGPSTLRKWETGTYTVQVTVSDAAAAQATLVYDGEFFELVSGNVNGEWDTSSNTSTTATLTTIILRCKAEPGSSGSLSLSGKKVSRLTGNLENPAESVSCGGGSKTVSNPVPTQMSKPSTTSKPSATATIEPSSSPIPDLWTVIVGDITSSQSGCTINAQIQGDTQMPVSVLEQLKGKQGVLKIDFGDYSCTINGSDLNDIPENISTIDLSVSMDLDPELSEAADGNDVYQLHFSYHGALPGKFIYSFKAGNSKPGDTVYLYYYYGQAGVIEGIQSAVIDENGYVTFEIYHCSDYFISDKIIEGTINNFAEQDTAAQTQLEQSVQTISLLVLIICLAGVAIISIFSTMYFCKSGIFKGKES